ncbi:hypothetical protein COLU111180_09625 [Cohnella lubricantis]|uniref:Uncharacterized protein n=1 Tax=Cohnella lubricantis TaxID=2163172 RepID=A0A841TIW1_9BACL|nr:hypothetical protein [Cohnella lubricantis]MBB6678431.1 hypothetical protein [Cohnella lubricantis]MBP2116811.1 hypothetical protein [Cohnella lubricantis]
MPFLDWFHRIIKPESAGSREAILQRLSDLDNRLGQLESDVRSAPPLLIRHADKVVIEKVDLSSHLGTLQIDSLEGQLNIGVTYHGTPQQDELFPIASAEASARASARASDGASARASAPSSSSPPASSAAGSAHADSSAAGSEEAGSHSPRCRIRARQTEGRPAK